LPKPPPWRRSAANEVSDNLRRPAAGGPPSALPYSYTPYFLTRFTTLQNLSKLTCVGTE